jgi:hypothetical protein
MYVALDRCRQEQREKQCDDQKRRARENVTNSMLMSEYDRIQTLFRIVVVVAESADRCRRSEVALLCVDVLIGTAATRVDTNVAGVPVSGGSEVRAMMYAPRSADLNRVNPFGVNAP